MRIHRFLAGSFILGGLLFAAPTPAIALPVVPCNATALVNAITAANTAGGGALDLSPTCTYTLTAPNNGQNGLPIITTPIRINGNGSTITRSSVTDFRFFAVVGGGDLALKLLTLSNGRAGNGGALSVSNGGSLTLDSSTVTGNTATAVGGGAILDFGTVAINNSTLSNNTGAQGGALNIQPTATATFKGGTVRGNRSLTTIVSPAGAGIVNFGSLTLSDTRLTGNDAIGNNAQGGALVNSGGTVVITGGVANENVADGADAHGGAISNIGGGSLDVSKYLVTNNTATGTNSRGGGISNMAGTTKLTASQVWGNKALGTGANGGGIFSNAGTFTLGPSTNIYSNLPNNCGSPSTVTGCS